MNRITDKFKEVDLTALPYSTILTHFLVIPYLFFIGFYGVGGNSSVPRSAFRLLYFGSFIAYLYSSFLVWKNTKSLPQLLLYIILPVPILIFIVFLSTRTTSNFGSILSDLENKKPSFGI